MKILFLGNKNFLSELLFNLQNLDILQENQVDICIAAPSGSSLLHKLKKLKNLKAHALLQKTNEKILLKLLKSQYKGSQEIIVKNLFPEKSLSFLNFLPNVQFIKYRGLKNIQNLDSYDLMIVASFSEKISQNIYSLPQKGTLNIHSSLLPTLRGGYPFYVQAYDESVATATTIHRMAEGWDDGNIVLQKKVPRINDLTSWDIFTQSANDAAQMLQKLHEKNFVFTSTRQKDSLASYCQEYIEPKSCINCMQDTDNLEGYVRANYINYLFPFTYCFYGFNLLIVMGIKKMNETDVFHSKRNIAVFKKNKAFYIKFYNKMYLVTRCIFQGELIEN